MKKSIIILLGLVAIVGVGYANRSSLARLASSSGTPQVSQNIPTPTAVDTDHTGTSETLHPYTEFSPDALSTARDTRRVLFFYANWCPTCREAHADFVTKMSSIPERVTVIRVNYNDSDTDDQEKSLARKFSVSYQHTFVEIDSEGNQLKKWNGGGVDELLSNTQ